VSFIANTRGVALMETVIVLPLFLFLTFASIDFGTFFINKYRSADMVSSVARVIEDRPSITEAEFNTLLPSLLRSPITQNDVFIASFSARPSQTTIENITGRNWQIPNGHPAGKPYYVVVTIRKTVNTITPLVQRLTGSLSIKEYVIFSSRRIEGDLAEDTESFTLEQLDRDGTESLLRVVRGFKTCVLSGHRLFFDSKPGTLPDTDLQDYHTCSCWAQRAVLGATTMELRVQTVQCGVSCDFLCFKYVAP
jgi:hypothetical protein